MMTAKKLLPTSRIGKNVLSLMGGTAMAQAITAASMPIVSRLYSPEMIGVISLYLSFFNFWLPLLAWRYENALLIAEDEEESHHIFRLGLLLTIFNAALAIPAMGILHLTCTLGFDVLPVWTPLIVFISLLGYGFFMLYRAWLLRLREARVISLSAVARSGANVAVRILTGIANLGIYGLLFAEVCGSWAALSAVRNRTKKLLQSRSPKWSWYKVKKAAKLYRKYAQYEMPSVAVDQLAIALPVPAIATLYGAQAAGWFGLAMLLYAIPNGQIGKAVGDVFQMELGYCVRDGDYIKGEKLFYKFSLGLLFVGVLPLILALYAAPPLVPYIFGEEWREMGEIVAHMAPWMFMALIVGSLSRALSVLQKQQWKLLYDLSALLVVVLIFFLSKYYQLELMDFMRYLSFGMALTYLLYFFIIAFAIRVR